MVGRSAGFKLGVSGDLDQDYAVTYGYDNAGRLGTVTDPNGSYTYGYVPNSLLRHTVTGPAHVTTTTYEPYRNVIDIVENKVGATTVSKFDYAVNSLGQRTQRANTGTAFGTASTDLFDYNDKGEVESVTNATLPTRNQSYTYDDIGNRLSFVQNSGTTNYTANTLNQYTLIGTTAPSMDPDGNMTATGTGQLYTWDAENRLLSIQPMIPAAGAKKQLNTYDAQSRRVRKQEFTYTAGSWSLTTDEKYIYDGWNLVAVLDAASSPTLLRTYTWGLDLSGSQQGAGGVGGLLSAKDGSSVYHYTYDANGNVSEVLTNTGSIAAHYEYDAFGNTVVASGTYSATNTYRFSTKPLDEVGGMYYYGFRYYNPSTGRWPSRDPIGEEGGLNLYGMVGNDSVNNSDYLGLAVEVELEFDPESTADTPWEWGNDSNPRKGGWTAATRASSAITCGIGLLEHLSSAFGGSCCVSCEISIEFKIYLNESFNKSITWDQVLGHEQRHVTSIKAEVRKIKADIEKEKGCFTNQSDTEKAVKDIENKYRKRLDDFYTKEAAHLNSGSPKIGTGVPSLPGSPVIK